MTQPTPPADPYPNAETLLRGVMDDWDDDAPEAAAPSPEQPEALPSDDEDSDAPEPVAPKAAATVDGEKARKAAKLAGLPESVLTRMSPEELDEWYSSHSKSESDVRRAFRENAEFRRELEELKATKVAEPAVPTAAEDQELVQIFTEEFGPERGKALADKWAAQRAQVLKPVQAMQAALEERLTNAAWQDTRQRLGIPDDTKKQIIVDRARALSEMKGMPWSSLKGDEAMAAVFSAAARIVDPDLPSDAEIRRRAVREEARRNGSPTAAPQRAAPKVPKTHEEIQDARLSEIIFKGATDPTKLRRIGT